MRLRDADNLQRLFDTKRGAMFKERSDKLDAFNKSPRSASEVSQPLCGTTLSNVDQYKRPCGLEVRYLLWVITTASGRGSIPCKALSFSLVGQMSVHAKLLLKVQGCRH